jgi:hypothetical protein
MDDVDSLVGAVLRLASVRAAVENFEISELDMQAAFLKGLLTSIPMKPPPRIAENSEITCPRITSFGLDKQCSRGWWLWL